MNAQERRERIYSNFRTLERLAKWAATEEIRPFPKLKPKKITILKAPGRGLVYYRIPTMTGGALKVYDFPFTVYRFPHRLGYFVQIGIATNSNHLLATGELIIVVDEQSNKVIFPA